LPASLVSIGSSAFAGQSEEDEEVENSITSIEFLGNNLTTIGAMAFEYNQIGGTVVIPSSVVTIGASAFSNNQISSLNLTNATNLQSIEWGAFGGNQIGGTLTIPSSVTKIESLAFTNNSLEILNLGSGIRTLGQNSFAVQEKDGNDHTLTLINIDMTSDEWSQNVSFEDLNGNPQDSVVWYSGSPEIKYNP